MIDFIWLFLFLVGVITTMMNGRMDQISKAVLEGAKSGVDLTMALIAVIKLWLGLMHIFQKAGAIDKLSRALRPIGRWLFPSIPDDSPAMGE